MVIFGMFLGDALCHPLWTTMVWLACYQIVKSQPSISAVLVEGSKFRLFKSQYFPANMALWKRMFSKYTSCPCELPKVGVRDTAKAGRRSEVDTRCPSVRKQEREKAILKFSEEYSNLLRSRKVCPSF